MSEFRGVKCDAGGDGCEGAIAVVQGVSPGGWLRTSVEVRGELKSTTLHFDVCSVCAASKPIVTHDNIAGAIKDATADLARRAEAQKARDAEIAAKIEAEKAEQAVAQAGVDVMKPEVALETKS